MLSAKIPGLGLARARTRLPDLRHWRRPAALSVQDYASGAKEWIDVPLQGAGDR
jgi:hypothetical protein